MKVYYCENLIAEGVEEFYLLDTGFGVVIELDSDPYFTTYKSIKAFKECWTDFDSYAKLTRVL